MKPLAIDMFSGLGGWTEGLLAEGYRVVGFDNVRHVYGEARYPAQLVLQDVLTLHGAQFKDAALIVASPPCFVADTLILTVRGMIPIPDVVAGDFVLTHHNRWRRVLRTGSTTAATYIARGYGSVLEGTADHPVYARGNSGSSELWLRKHLESPDWIPLAALEGAHWACPAAFDPLPIPVLPNGAADTTEFWWMVGRWVGDGWVRLRQESTGDEVCICCAHDEADDLHDRLLAVAPRQGARAMVGEFHWRRSPQRTAVRLSCASNALAEWLVLHFGRGAANKHWPAWALGMHETNRLALLGGYLSADGSIGMNGPSQQTRATTVSKALAMGTRLLAASLGYAATVHFTSRPRTAEIEGRQVHQQDTWTTEWNVTRGGHRMAELDGGMFWGAVRNVTVGQSIATVWNLEVDEDQSYVANGVVVHNCQAYSYRAMPWTRAKALPPPDNTLFEACFRIQREACEAAGRHIPLVVENVRGAQTWVGRARWHSGPYYFWGDVPGLMPQGHWHKQAGHWFKDSGVASGSARFASTSVQRREWSARVAKIPFELSRWIARAWYPRPPVEGVA